MNGMAKLLQGLFYISSLYQGYIAEHHLNIYSSTQLKLPKPKYIVFYNGTRDEPDRQELRLSASFAEEGGAPCIECVALVLNINYGRNRKLMEACKKLHDYSYFVASVREFLQEGLALAEAVDCAVQHCIRENVLREFLEIHRLEVKEMILSEYYEDFHRQMMCEEARAQGLADGTAQGIAKGRAQGIAEGKAQGIAEGKAQGIAEGKAQGIAEGKAQGIAEGQKQAFRQALLQYIDQNWKLSKSLDSKIQAQENSETLQRWLSLAWESESVEELEEKMAQS